METHLRAELDLDRYGSLRECASGTVGGREGAPSEEDEEGERGSTVLPLHMVLTEEAISFDDFRRLESACYRFVGGDGCGEYGWKRSPFCKVDHELRVLEYIRDSPHRLLALGEPVGRLAGDIRAKFAVFLSVGICCDRDGAVSPSGVVRLRLILKATGGRLAFGRESREVLDIDFAAKDVVASRKQFADRFPDGPPRRAASSSGRAHPGPPSSLTEITRSSRDVESLTDDAGEADSEMEAIGCGPRFFDIVPDRKMSKQLSSYLSKFIPDLEDGGDGSGPLEPPSVVRGRTLVARMGVSRGDVIEAAVAEREDLAEAAAAEAASAVEPSLTGRWFDVQSYVSVRRLRDLCRTRTAVAVWYEHSLWADVRLRERASAVSDRNAGRGGILSSMRDVSLAVSGLCAAVARGLSESLASLGSLSQHFSCAVPENVDFGAILDLLCISKDVWINTMGENSCIIKAIVYNIQREHADSRDSCDSESGRVTGRWWADVIDCVRGKLYGGLPVSLRACERTGLFISHHEDGRETEWVRDPGLCVVYANCVDLQIYWVVPGGFAVPFNVNTDGVRLECLRDRLEVPEAVSRKGVRMAHRR
uniref:GP93 n=1 Tax=Caviid herpesvirus 2 str. CIDMTR TaxID=1415526 RepID=U6HC51_9BETA|nr:GP93 [Caviid herpesvirus 2 str. CIDMTR]